MSSQTLETTNAAALGRVLAEGYGPNAWHGANFKMALADVGEELAFARPAPDRHTIAEIAVHHAYYVRVVRERLSGAAAEPFILEGDDWFSLPASLSWNAITTAVDAEQEKLSAAVSNIAEGAPSPLAASEQFDQILGITCHAVYHAGQVQLIKKLVEGRQGR